MEDYKEWYIDKRPTYESLLATVMSIIESLLRRENIRFYHVETRVKEFDEFEAKLVDQKYTQPEEMTDFAALRVICYLKQDKAIVTGLLEDNFRIIKREDKSIELRVDRIGYNAIHLDAMLAKDRSGLPEYQRYKDLKFEIQITTILQHAYAQIEHDLIYKTGNVLPEGIQRSIKKTSGGLDILDDMFEQIMKDIDVHKRKSKQIIDKGELDLPIDSPSLRRYLLKKFGDIPDFKPQFGSVSDNYIIEQLHFMGIKTIADFQKIIPANFKEKYLEIPSSTYGTYATGLVVWLLIIHDYKKYFDEVYKESYGIFDTHDFHVFEKFGLDTSKFPRNLFNCK